MRIDYTDHLSVQDKGVKRGRYKYVSPKRLLIDTGARYRYIRGVS